MTEVAAALRDAAAQLAATSETPRLDAELLMAHALGVTRSDLLLDPARHAVPDGFAALIDRRAVHEPVAYIIGSAEFWSLPFMVGPGVLIPRGDSETLIEAALAHFGGRMAPRAILDLGTGPGTLLLAALSAFSDARGLGIDASDTALDYAARNAAALGLAERATFRRGNWADGVAGPFDLILCNPPYIAADERLMPDVADHEPAEALFAGVDGLDDYRRIIPVLPALLAAGGAAIMEIGAGQADAVGGLAKEAGFAVAARRDLGGHARALVLTRADGDGCNQ